MDRNMLLLNKLTHSHKTSRKFRAEQYCTRTAGGGSRAWRSTGTHVPPGEARFALAGSFFACGSATPGSTAQDNRGSVGNNALPAIVDPAGLQEFFPLVRSV